MLPNSIGIDVALLMASSNASLLSIAKESRKESCGILWVCVASGGPGVTDTLVAVSHITVTGGAFCDGLVVGFRINVVV